MTSGWSRVASTIAIVAVAGLADDAQGRPELDDDPEQGAHRLVVVADQDADWGSVGSSGSVAHLVGEASSISSSSGTPSLRRSSSERLTIRGRSRGSEEGLAGFVAPVELEGEMGDREPLDDSVVELEHLSPACERQLGFPENLCVAVLERALNVLELGKAPQRDVDRALQLFRPGVHDVGVHAALRCLVDPLGVVGLEQGDHRAERAPDDLGDQLQRVVRALAEPDQRHVGTLPRCHCAHL